MYKIFSFLLRKLCTKVKKNFILFLILSFSFLINLILFIRNPNFGGDSIQYLIPIHNFINGEGYTFFGTPELLMPPGYGILSFFIYLLIKNLNLDPRFLIPFSGMIVSSLSYLISIILVFLITNKLFNKKVALIASFLIAFNSSFIGISFITLSESCFILFILLCFYIFINLIHSVNKKKIKFFILGIILGFTYLIRPEAFIIFIFVLILFFIKAIREKKKYKKSSILILFIGFAIISGPYIIFLRVNLGYWTISPKTTINLLVGEGVVEGNDHVRKLKEEFPEYFNLSKTFNIFEYIIARGDKFLLRIFYNIINESKILIKLTYIIGLFFLFFFTFDYIFQCKIKQHKLFISYRKKKIILLINFFIFISPLFSYVFFFIHTRFILPYSIFLLILISQGIAKFIGYLCNYIKKLKINRINNFKNIKKCKKVLIVLIPFLLYFINIMDVSKLINYTHSNHSLIEAGIYLDEINLNMKNTTISSVGKAEVILFFAGGYKGNWGNYIKLPINLTLDTVSNFLKIRHIDYLILDSNYIKDYPQLNYLWKNPYNCSLFNLTLFHNKFQIFQIYQLKN